MPAPGATSPRPARRPCLTSARSSSASSPSPTTSRPSLLAPTARAPATIASQRTPTWRRSCGRGPRRCAGPAPTSSCCQPIGGPTWSARCRRRSAPSRGLADDGTVDLFWGHSAHVFQGVERRGSGLILYDTGDFLDDYQTDARLRNDWSFIFLIDLEGGRLARLRLVLVPVTLKLAQVNLAEGADAAGICLRMQAAAAQLGTRLTPTAEGLELPLPGTAPASS